MITFIVLFSIIFWVVNKLDIKASKVSFFCDPTGGVATAMVIMSVAGGTKAYGEYQQGKAQNQYYQYLANSAVAQGNAIAAQKEKQSELEQDKASWEGKKANIQGAEFKAKQIASMVASGAGTSGTAEDIVKDTFNKQKMDEAMIKYNADVASWSLTEEGRMAQFGAEQQANQYRYAGKQAKKAATMKSLTTLLSTAASVASMGMGATATTPGVGSTSFSGAPGMGVSGVKSSTGSLLSVGG